MSSERTQKALEVAITEAGNRLFSTTSFKTASQHTSCLVPAGQTNTNNQARSTTTAHAADVLAAP